VIKIISSKARSCAQHVCCKATYEHTTNMTNIMLKLLVSKNKLA